MTTTQKISINSWVVVSFWNFNVNQIKHHEWKLKKARTNHKFLTTNPNWCFQSSSEYTGMFVQFVELNLELTSKDQYRPCKFDIESRYILYRTHQIWREDAFIAPATCKLSNSWRCLVEGRLIQLDRHHQHRLETLTKKTDWKLKHSWS